MVFKTPLDPNDDALYLSNTMKCVKSDFKHPLVAACHRHKLTLASRVIKVEAGHIPLLDYKVEIAADGEETPTPLKTPKKPTRGRPARAQQHASPPNKDDGEHATGPTSEIRSLNIGEQVAFKNVQSFLEHLKRDPQVYEPNDITQELYDEFYDNGPRETQSLTKQIYDFKAQKLDPKAYPIFTGKIDAWFGVKRSWTANAKYHGIADVLDPTKPIPPEGDSEARQL